MSTDPTRVQNLQNLQALIAEAVVDPSVRQKLIDSPAQALQDAKVTVPPGVTVKFHANTATEINLVIPSSEPLLLTEPVMLLPFIHV